eukprot:ANDGO_07965.mRNA.1 putative elongator complex protein 2
MELQFLGIGTNRTPHCMAYDDKTRTLVYGGGCFVVLFSVDAGRTVASIKAATTAGGRRPVVTTVAAHNGYAYAGCNDASVSVVNLASRSIINVLKCPSADPVECVAVDQTFAVKDCGEVPGKKWLVSVSANSDVCVWDLSDCSLFQKIEVPNKRLGLACAVCADVLAFSATDDSVHVYKWGENGQFVPYAVAKGHKNWVQSVQLGVSRSDFRQFVYMVSGSQDQKVRLWKISRDASARVKIACDSVMSAHDNTVCAVAFNKSHYLEMEGVCCFDEVMSVSADRSVIRWRVDHDVWSVYRRVGEFGGTAGIFGQQGFVGGTYIRNDRYVVLRDDTQAVSDDQEGYFGSAYFVYAFNGALHLYDREVPSTVAVGGHADAVMDIAWDDHYLLSTSTDQTSRLWDSLNAHSARMAKIADSDRCSLQRMMEISRPQIHGYNMCCIGSLLAHKPHSFVSGAEEKVLRIFEAPATFITSLQNLTDYRVKSPSLELENRPLGASVPELGLTNRPITQLGENGAFLEADAEFARPFEPMAMQAPPLEEHRLQNTLWPETAKLYGHANEIVAVAVSPDGKLMASSCRAAQGTFAAPILWDTATSTKKHVFAGEAQFTVTQLEFSPDGRHLLCVTRDRSFFVYETVSPFACVAREDKAHDRILWSCSWNANGTMFATCSRDKSIKLWTFSQMNGKCSIQCAAKLQCSDPQTAVSFFKNDKHDSVLASGSETGSISVYKVDREGTLNPLFHVSPAQMHAETVRKCVWKRLEESGGIALATCSTDGSIRVFSVDEQRML